MRTHKKTTHKKTIHKKTTHKKTIHKKTYKGGFRYGKQNNWRTPTPGEILIARSPKKKNKTYKK
jgi:hypothetical protein